MRAEFGSGNEIVASIRFVLASNHAAVIHGTAQRRTGDVRQHHLVCAAKTGMAEGHGEGVGVGRAVVSGGRLVAGGRDWERARRHWQLAACAGITDGDGGHGRRETRAGASSDGHRTRLIDAGCREGLHNGWIKTKCVAQRGGFAPVRLLQPSAQPQPLLSLSPPPSSAPPQPSLRAPREGPPTPAHPQRLLCTQYISLQRACRHDISINT